MEALINQKRWPIISKYIGSVDDYTKETTWPDTDYVGRCGSDFWRVYGDEINLDTNRIKNVKTLKHCYESGYTKDIEWK